MIQRIGVMALGALALGSLQGCVLATAGAAGASGDYESSARAQAAPSPIFQERGD